MSNLHEIAIYSTTTIEETNVDEDENEFDYDWELVDKVDVITASELTSMEQSEFDSIVEEIKKPPNFWWL